MQEAVLDLGVEQVLSPALAAVNNAFVQTMIEHGIPIEAIVTELVLSGEVERTYRLLREVGYAVQSEFHSPTSQYGQLTRRGQYDHLDFARDDARARRRHRVGPLRRRVGRRTRRRLPDAHAVEGTARGPRGARVRSRPSPPARPRRSRLTTAAVAGIGQTRYAKNMGRTELDLATEAIRKACADAGLPVTAVDGFVSYHIEQVNEVDLVTALGLPDVRFMTRHALGRRRRRVVAGHRRARGRERGRQLRRGVPRSQPLEGRVVRRRSESGRPALGEGWDAPARTRASGTTRSASPRPRTSSR